MTTLNEDELRRLHQRFDAGHDVLRQRLLDRLSNEPAPQSAPPEPRWRPRRWLLPTAISGIAAAVAIGVAASLWFLLPDGTGQISWAGTIAQMRQVKSVTFISRQHTTSLDGSSQDAYETRVYVRWPSQQPFQQRSEFIGTRPRGAQSLGLENPTGFPNTSWVYRDGKLTHVNTTLTFGRGSGGTSFHEFLVKAVNLNEKDVVRAGEEMMDGRKLVRFDARAGRLGGASPEAHMTISIWVDPATSLPVRVVEKFHPLRAPNADERTTEMADIKFDLPMDDKLFAAPDLDAARETLQEQWLMIEDAAHARFTISSPDGTVLASTDDLTPSTGQSQRLSDSTLAPAALGRLAKFTADHIGQKLTVRLDNVGSEEVTIFAPVKNVRLWD